MNKELLLESFKITGMVFLICTAIVAVLAGIGYLFQNHPLVGVIVSISLLFLGVMTNVYTDLKLQGRDRRWYRDDE